MSVIDGMRQDVKGAFRGLPKSPGFAITALLPLALDIGATSAIFGSSRRLRRATRFGGTPGIIRPPTYRVPVPGTRLGPYEILGPLGIGGMGEVWRAHDTRLDRDVAIKILPDSFAHDPERLARFQREAKTLAALNHPNIGHIYGLEESAGMTALILELVEGPHSQIA